jgi:hypothetical protein
VRHWLFTEQGKVYLLEEYVARARSTYEIAADRARRANSGSR